MHGNAQLVDSILSLLYDADHFLRQCAFEIIHSFKDEQAIQALVKALQDTALRERVTGALTNLGDKRTVPFFIRMLERDVTSAIVAINVLVALNNPQAIPHLLMQLSNPNKTLVKETLRVLAILTTADYASEVLQAVMVIRDQSENEIKDLANKTATSIIKRFGRKVLPTPPTTDSDERPKGYKSLRA